MPKSLKSSKKEKTSVSSVSPELSVSLTLGIDEAGRGPVLGPLVMAGVVLSKESEKILQDAGVKDSKLLTAEKRSALYGLILAQAYQHKIVILDPASIDAALSSARLNLNWLEAHKAAEIINELSTKNAIVDCPSPNIPAYKLYLLNLLQNKQINLVLEHKAEKHIPVAAASILAKVTRDRIVEELKKQIGIDFGSGYMTDQLTQDFLKHHHDKYPTLFRKQWQSYKDAVTEKKQKKLGEY